MGFILDQINYLQAQYHLKYFILALLHYFLVILLPIINLPIFAQTNDFQIFHYPYFRYTILHLFIFLLFHWYPHSHYLQDNTHINFTSPYLIAVADSTSHLAQLAHSIYQNFIFVVVLVCISFRGHPLSNPQNLHPEHHPSRDDWA